MKKLLSYLLVIALVLVQFTSVVSAEEVNSGTQSQDGTITIENPVAGQTYEIYKLFDLESYDKSKNAYTYTISKNSVWYEFVKDETYVNLEESVDNKYVVTWKENADVAAFARAALTYAETNNITNQGSITAQENGVIFENLPLGYYLVDSSLGTVVSLDTTVKDVTIKEKNTPPTIDKDIIENGNVDSNTANIGDKVNYEVEINAKKGAQSYVLTDTMTEGLTFNNDVVVTAGDDTLVEGTDYTIVYPAAGETFTFKVEFKKAYLDAIETSTDIIVTYSATINENAVINGTGNVNSATLKYGDSSETEPSYVRTYVLAFDLIKTDSNQTQLAGAEFELYKEATGGEAIQFVIDEGNYRVATAIEISNSTITKVTKIAVGTARIEGLDEGTYYLEETKAPEGYNKLTSRVPVTLVSEIEADGFTQITKIENQDTTQFKYTNDDVTVINTTGSLLPSTGGMGTVLFITVGSIMVLGFGVLLVTKLRLSKMDI